MDGRDVGLVGLAIDISGALLLAKGFMVKSALDIYDETGTRLGRNLASVKSIMIQRAEAQAGAALLFLGFSMQIFAALEVRSTERILSGWWGLATLLAGSAALFAAGWAACAWYGRSRFYEWALRNYSETPFSVPATPREVAEQEHLGRLYDVPRRAGEDVATFTSRLNAAVDSLGQRHRGKVRLPSDS